jgi:thioredoxin/glutathione reductase (selenoprotein)
METEQPTYDFDLFVIGGGSGGLAASKKAASFGAKVALADFVKPSPQGTAWGLGGTCVNVGCIPKKLMHFASMVGELREDQKECGWNIDTSLPHSWETMIEHVNNHIRSLNWNYKKQLIQKEVKYFNALASLKDAHTINLKDKNGKETTVTAKYVLLAMGGRPTLLNLPGARELCITSDDLFWKKEAPGKTLIIGAGYIAMECAGFIKGLGHTVDVLYRSAVLRAFDQDMASRVVQHMQESGINFIKGNPVAFTKVDSGINATIKALTNNGENELNNVYDTVLFAVGRYADVSGIGLEELNVKLDAAHKIVVDKKWQTSVPNIYAIGDIIADARELTPIAIKEGQYLVDGLFTNKWREIDYRAVATTIFTPLEYSCSGYSETEAFAAFGEDNIEVYHRGFKPLEWNFLESHSSNSCYTKIIVHIPDQRILGIHYIGPNAGEVMQGYSIAVRLRLKYEDLAETVGIHPTTAEELVGLTTTKRESPDATNEGC